MHILTQITDKINCGIVVIYRRFLVQYWNRGMEIHSGLEASTVNGKSIIDVYPNLNNQQFIRNCKSVLSLISADAPIDRYLLGDANALSEDAKKGLDIFKGKGMCIRCHYGKAIVDNRFHAIGVSEKDKHIKDDKIAITRRFVAKLHGFKNYKLLE